MASSVTRSCDSRNGAIAPQDLPSLAGKWVGMVTLPSGKTTPGTMEMSPNSDYVARAEAFSAQGKANSDAGPFSFEVTRRK
jgi:hypothetical protein